MEGLAVTQLRAEVLDCHWRLTPVKHGMTIRADRYKVCDWIDAVFDANRRDWPDMVNMYEARAKGTIALAKVHPANLTDAVVVRDASGSSVQRALEPIHNDLLGNSLKVLFALREIIGPKSSAFEGGGLRGRQRRWLWRWLWLCWFHGCVIREDSDNFVGATALPFVELKYLVERGARCINGAPSGGGQAKGVAGLRVILPNEHTLHWAIFQPHASDTPNFPKEVLCAVIPIDRGVERLMNAVLSPRLLVVHGCEVDGHVRVPCDG